MPPPSRLTDWSKFLTPGNLENLLDSFKGLFAQIPQTSSGIVVASDILHGLFAPVVELGQLWISKSFKEFHSNLVGLEVVLGHRVFHQNSESADDCFLRIFELLCVHDAFFFRFLLICDKSHLDYFTTKSFISQTYSLLQAFYKKE